MYRLCIDFSTTESSQVCELCSTAGCQMTTAAFVCSETNVHLMIKWAQWSAFGPDCKTNANTIIPGPRRSFWTQFKVGTQQVSATAVWFTAAFTASMCQIAHKYTVVSRCRSLWILSIQPPVSALYLVFRLNQTKPYLPELVLIFRYVL